MTELSSAAPQAGGAWRYRMKDLCELTGLGRQAIHFYIQRGLLPPGRKTGRNMAYYGDEHVERLRLIRRLQHERFLPLKAIKAILDDQQGAFEPTQRRFLIGVRQHLSGELVREGSPPPVRVDDVLARTGVSRRDFDRMAAIELLQAGRDEAGREVIRADDAWLLETWAEIQRLGFVEDLGFTVDDLQVFEDAVSRLFQQEVLLLASRIQHVDPARAAVMVERVLPVVNALLVGLHQSKVRDFVSSIEADGEGR
ncbi:MAG: MerR family transcriptional regulator [Sandaracinaceae bacterium]